MQMLILKKCVLTKLRVSRCRVNEILLSRECATVEGYVRSLVGRSVRHETANQIVTLTQAHASHTIKLRDLQLKYIRSTGARVLISRTHFIFLSDPAHDNPGGN